MKEDAVSNAMELLEMYCGAVLEGLSSLEKEYANIVIAANLSHQLFCRAQTLQPAMVEAVSSIIYAASFKEFQGAFLT
jgi:hypothetical protein